ncbi:MAG: type I restriction modification enzyme protein S [Nitrospirales bacterium]|nr:MAG: type I restriction modification enzyme protein S [Nitrospirales bacterium]
MKKEWQTKKLGEVIQLVSGQHIDAKDYNTDSRGVGYLTGPSDFGSINPIISKWTEFPKVKAKLGDILITVKGSGVGKINLLDQDEVAISRQLMAVRVTRAEPRFVYAFLSSTFDHFQSESTGAAIPGISREQVLGMKIAVPPLPEQQRIVGILDEAFESIATAKVNAEKNLKNARALFESHLHSVFTHRGEGWVEKSLAELCDPSRGITYGVIKLGKEVQDGVPCLRTSNVRWLRIETKGMKRIAPALSAEYSRTILRGGEILVNVRGTLGGVAVVGSEMIGWNVSREVAMVPINPSRINPIFLSYLIGSGLSQKWLGGVKKGAAYVGINLEDLRLLPVSAPKLDEQSKIVNHLDTLNEETQRLASIYQQKLAALDALKKSLLHQAFTGEL